MGRPTGNDDEGDRESWWARRLADNDPTVRRRAVRRLGRWLRLRSDQDLSEEDLIKIWKGLFYCLWMCDKPLVQEELAASIARMLFMLHQEQVRFLFIETFFVTMVREWIGIDQQRLDKFLMLVRQMINASFELLKKSEWNDALVRQFLDLMKRYPANAAETNVTVPLGFQCHVADVYVEELIRVGESQLTTELGNLFLEPYCQLMAHTSSGVLLERVNCRVFEYVIRVTDIDFPESTENQVDEDVDVPEPTESQEVEVDEYIDVPEPMEKREAEDVDVQESTENQEVEVDEYIDVPEPTEEEPSPDGQKRVRKKKKPKKKYVAVSHRRLVQGKLEEAMSVPLFSFDYVVLADRLFALGSSKRAHRRNRIMIYQLVRRLKLLSRGHFPLDPEMPKPGRGLLPRHYKRATKRLAELDKECTRESGNFKRAKRRFPRKPQ